MSKNKERMLGLIMSFYDMSSKLHGLGHLLQNSGSDTNGDCDDNSEVYKGVGLILKDLAQEIQEQARVIYVRFLTVKGNDNDE